MAIPIEITATHIKQAFDVLKNKKNLRKPTKYEVIYEGVRYPPKEVIRAAHRICFGNGLLRFSGGDESNDFLIRRGFKVVLIDTNEEIPLNYVRKKRENEQKILEINEGPLFDIDLLDINKYKLKETEVETVIKARLGHSMFKKQLHNIYKKCALCDIEQPALLIASHIKPWSQSNSKERLDIYNGLLFCPNHDMLFDKGYITFNRHGQLMVSTQLHETTKAQLGLRNQSEINLYKNSKNYMEWHYHNVFKWS